MKPITLRLLTPEEVAEREAPRCQSRPTPRSLARCEAREGHPPDRHGKILHAGRTPRGYWKFWTTEPEEPHDAG